MHFPTDFNLTWDSMRKCFDITGKLVEQGKVSWRKLEYTRRSYKSHYRSTCWQAFKGKNIQAKQKSVQSFLNESKLLIERFLGIVTQSDFNSLLLVELLHYKNYAENFIDQIERRVIKNEVIDPKEKIYSIFEEHTEWINKGKPAIELGHMVSITTNQHHLIVDYHVMDHEKDASQVTTLLDRLKKNYPEQKVYSHSFDKGYFSGANYKALEEAGVEHVILPKKGKLNKAELERENTPIFKKLRHAHSAIESNINMLEHHGLDRCPDRGMHGYRRYVGMCVLSYNLHIIGNHLVKEDEKKEERRKRRRDKYRQVA